MDCEICGRPAVAEAIVEGARLNVCPACAAYGRVTRPPAAFAPPRPAAAPVRRALQEIGLVPDYGRRIARARQERGLSRDDLARSVFIRANELAHFEAAKLKPEEKIARKLEKFLGVQLLVEETPSAPAPASSTAPARPPAGLASRPPAPAPVAAEPTLGDFVVVKKKNA